ncbi:hypothetical protein HOV35_gp03 [Escherichia phage Sortsne]|uniref:Uncharacterized protein n=1 Tax=Escherichia phage Sortsne TaxID=2562456 RepID=A0A4D6DZ62_9CAUD|nr:hypothetical protein HOV35_gp03 [Escherichia phage Sortsne]QBZ71568.1 hypothetical protein [Escherichia phage Sortsne]
MKKLLMRIVTNITIMIAVYVVVMFFAPGHIKPGGLEAVAAALTLAVLVALDYVRDFIVKVLDQKGEA